MKTRTCIIALLLLAATTAFAQSPRCPFTRGFNLGGWFQGDSAGDIQNSYTITDLEQMMALGIDHVRLPIDLYNMSGNGPWYVIDPLLLMYVDRVVDWAEELGLYILLDNHSHMTLGEDPERRQRLIAVWQQMAEHFKDRSELVLYEIHNEPVGISAAEWGYIQRAAINAIRTIDSKHTLVVSPGEVGSYDYFDELPWYTDNNLLYTFHFYDPFIFTHQGTNWTSPSMENVTGVPYPYDAGRMPSMPGQFVGTWLGQLWSWYAAAGTPASLANRMRIPVRFRDNRRVPIHCGEFGVWQFGPDPAERAQWHADVRALLDADNIAWTMWGYRGGFGIFRKDSPGAFPYDLDTAVVEALGLTVPPPEVISPETSGMVLYDDLVNGRFFYGGHSGTLDIHDTGDPAEGVHCLRWNGAGRYGAVTWRLSTPLDLSCLKDEGYNIRFMIKTDMPGLRFDMRFVDTDLGNGQDHPWRMVKTIDNGMVAMNGRWQVAEFALKDMLDAGSWHNNTWYNSEGKFDWTRIDRFEIVAEHHDIQGRNLWLDQIEIVNP